MTSSITHEVKITYLVAAPSADQAPTNPREEDEKIMRYVLYLKLNSSVQCPERCAIGSKIVRHVKQYQNLSFHEAINRFGFFKKNLEEEVSEVRVQKRQVLSLDILDYGIIEESLKAQSDPNKLVWVMSVFGCCPLYE